MARVWSECVFRHAVCRIGAVVSMCKRHYCSPFVSGVVAIVAAALQKRAQKAIDSKAIGIL